MAIRDLQLFKVSQDSYHEPQPLDQLGQLDNTPRPSEVRLIVRSCTPTRCGRPW